jgi:hypothetical protein
MSARFRDGALAGVVVVLLALTFAVGRVATAIEDQTRKAQPIPCWDYTDPAHGKPCDKETYEWLQRANGRRP